MTGLTYLNWNIGNPSTERAKNQADLIREQNADIIVLTETRDSQGCALLDAALSSMGYNVHFPRPIEKEYGVLIASKQRHEVLPSRGPKGQAARAPMVCLDDGTKVVGIYVPSNARDSSKRYRKRSFLQYLAPQLSTLSKEPCVLLADTNTIPSNHNRIYQQFDGWELEWMDSLLNEWEDVFALCPEPTWISWRGEPYRYDYCLLGDGLYASDPEILIDWRQKGKSDHAALYFKLNSTGG